MIPYWITPIYSLYFFRNSIKDVPKFYFLCHKIRSGDILESLHKFRTSESAELKTVLELYDMESHQKRSMPHYQKLKTMVQSSIDQKLRLRNFGTRHGKIDTGAVVKNRNRTIGVEGGKGICYQWKEKSRDTF